MAESSTFQDLAYEQSINEAYLSTLTERLSRPIAVGATRNELWLKGYPSLRKALSALHPLVARVGLEYFDEVVPRSFYIGPMHHTWNGEECFSWAAPIAEVFFRPDQSIDAIAEQVVVRRSFDTRIDEIIRLHDEWVRQTRESPFNAPRLAVPAAPARTPRRRHASPPESDSSQTDVSPPSIETPRRPHEPRPRTATERGPADVHGPLRTLSLTEGMRAPDVVLEKLRSPRSEHLTSVLATLQPDQHELAAAPPDAPLIIQGHPGTGKTIVAAYRAAHLTDSQRSGPFVSRVLLIGPTPGYVNHVVGLIAPLADPGKVRVVDMQTFLGDAAGVKTVGGGALDGVADDVDAAARGLADRAARVITERRGWKSGAGARDANLRALYELIRANGERARPLSNSPDKITWMKRLPEYDRAVKLRRFLPLMAQCGLSIQPPPHTDRYDHIIVDEAQDVSPIEWNVLDLFSRHGHWTLLGDMNQRRSDATYNSWSQIAEHLTLGADHGEVKPMVITRGYRSTQPILRFADQLLPRGLRGAQSLQTEGSPVVVKRAPMAHPLEHARVAVEEAMALRERHPHGTVALVMVDPGPVYQAMYKFGWRRTKGDDHMWTRDEERLAVHVPESARGLEFDGVVVLEPAAFPKNVGRAGQLYTSLTRANRELVIVHHRALPDELRRAGR